jgi:methyltransferase (TIGR00027 family)
VKRPDFGLDAIERPMGLALRRGSNSSSQNYWARSSIDGVILMDEERASLTAEGVAIQRAMHQTLDEDPEILNDPVAARLVDPSSDSYRSFVEGLERMPPSHRLHRRAYAVMRSRYTEDCLAEALARGIRQYVILGAGLDSFGYRQPSWAQSLRIFEIDHPATQRWKRQRLAAAQMEAPDNVAFAPIDFERVTLKDGLAASGFDFGVRTFFSWLGVMSYLTEQASDATLEFVSRCPVPVRLCWTSWCLLTCCRPTRQRSFGLSSPAS